MFRQKLIDNRDPFAIAETHQGALFIARRVEGVPLFKIAAGITAGALSDKIPGTAHFFEHLPFNETMACKNRDAERFFRDAGGYVNAYTSHDMTVFHGEAHHEHFSKSIFALSELVCRPVLTRNHVMQEAKTITTEWAKAASTQSIQRASRLRGAALGDNAPHEVVGTRETIHAIRLEDIEEFFHRNYVSDNLIVYMQGDVAPERMIAQAASFFALARGTPASTPALIINQPTTTVITGDRAEATHTALVFAAPTVAVDHKTRAACNLTTWILTQPDSPLLTEARQIKRLIYDLETNGEHMQRWGFSSIEFDTLPEQATDACGVVIRHLADVATNPNEELFQVLKETAIVQEQTGLMLDQQQNPADHISQIATTGIIHPPEAQLDALERLSIDDMAAFARTYFIESPLSVLYQGKPPATVLDAAQLATLLTSAEAPTRLPARDKIQRTTPPGKHLR